MKLSEVLSKPLSLIGGGKLNLKGFSKRVVDKEVGDKKINVYKDIESLMNTEFNTVYNFNVDNLIDSIPSINFTSNENIEIGTIVGLIDENYNCAIGKCISSEYYDDEDAYECTAEIIKRFKVNYGYYLS